MALRIEGGVSVDAYALHTKTQAHFRNLMTWEKETPSKSGGKPFKIYGLRLFLSKVGTPESIFVVSIIAMQKDEVYASLCNACGLDHNDPGAKSRLVEALCDKDLLGVINANDSKRLRFVSATSSTDSPGPALVRDLIHTHKKWLHGITSIAVKESDADLDLIKSALKPEDALDSSIIDSLED